MQLVNEYQKPPYKMVWLITLFTVVGCFLLTKVTDPAPASANLMYWTMDRSAGMTAYGLLSISVLLGLTSSSGQWDRWNLRKVMTMTHQFSALLVLPFLVFHLWGLYADQSMPFNWVSLFVPFAAKYHPFATGLGTLSLFSWIVIVATSAYREKIGVTAWRAIHMVSIPMFVAVTFHGLLAGTDTAKEWARILYLIPFVWFCVLSIRRFTRHRQVKRIPSKPTA